MKVHKEEGYNHNHQFILILFECFYSKAILSPIQFEDFCSLLPGDPIRAIFVGDEKFHKINQ